MQSFRARYRGVEEHGLVVGVGYDEDDGGLVDAGLDKMLDGMLERFVKVTGSAKTK